MIFTTIICLEVLLFVIWLMYRTAGMISRHKIFFLILVIGIVYFLIFGHSSNVVNTISQKNQNLPNAAHGSSLNEGIFSDSSKAAEPQSVLYPGDDCRETGADGHRIMLYNNGKAINPTYSQMINFVRSDKTDEIPYNYSSFACSDFAERIHNNAEANGYRCAWVNISFINGNTAYACNAFNTVDYGLVFVDCTNCGKSENDKTVDLKVGTEYRPIGIEGLHDMYYSMGIVKNYQIYW